MDMPSSLFYLLPSFQPPRESGVMRARLCYRTSLDELLGVLCGLASFAVGQGTETQINCRAETMGTFRSQLARGQAAMHFTWVGRTEASPCFFFRVGLLGRHLPLSGGQWNKEWWLKFSTWKGIRLGPAPGIPSPLKCSHWLTCWCPYTLSPRNWEAFEAHLVSSFTTEAWARLHLQMWPLRSLEEATISKHSIVIISWNIQAANLPTGVSVSFHTLGFTWCCPLEPS